MRKSQQFALLLLAALAVPGGECVPIVDPPAPIVAPIDAPGLHVLIVEESSERTPEIAAILNSPEWQSLVPPGQWRVLDKDTDMTSASPKWRAAMSRQRDSVPWLIASNPTKGGSEGPLTTLSDLVQTIERLR